MPLYRKRSGGFTKDGKDLLGKILLNARMRQDEGYGLSLEDFVEVVNKHWGTQAMSTNKVWRLENAAVVKPKEQDIGYLAPFSWSEAAGRPYSAEELVAIGKEQLDPADVGTVDAPSLNPH